MQQKKQESPAVDPAAVDPAAVHSIALAVAAAGGPKVVYPKS